jgi:hypothetical protein
MRRSIFPLHKISNVYQQIPSNRGQPLEDPHLATIHALAAKVQARALERFYCDLTFDPSGDFVPTEAGWSDREMAPHRHRRKHQTGIAVVRRKEA